MTEHASLEDAVALVLTGANSPHVVIGPLVHHEKFPQSYVIVSTSEADRGWRCSQIFLEDEEHRLAFLVALGTSGRALVVHDMADELEAARLCEMLWPGARITEVRKGLERGRMN